MNDVIIYMFQKHLCFLIYIFLPDVKSQLFRKHSDAGKDWRQEEKGDDRGWDGWMASLT